MEPIIITSMMERNASGSIPMLLLSGDAVGLATSRDKITEIWSLLEYYYDIEDSRDQFLKSKGIATSSQRKAVGTVFSSYMTQARNFYTYAQNSDYRSAALLYYFSFLNLAKAKLIIEQPLSIKKKFVHGIKRNDKSGGLSKLSSISEPARSTNRVATFPELYKLRFGRPWDDSKILKISNLIGYASDVAHEYSLVVGRRDKVARVKYVICTDNDRKKCWAKLAIHDAGKLAEYKQTFKSFNDEFQEIAIGPLTRQFTFDIKPHSTIWYKFFESKTEFDFIGADGVNTFACSDQLKRLFGNYYQTDVYDPNTSFQLLEPLRKNLQLPFDELLAIYVIMHHLSEVIRYEPYDLEELLSNKHKDGWLLKNFIESSPLTFLLRMSSWITGTHYFLESR